MDDVRLVLYGCLILLIFISYLMVKSQKFEWDVDDFLERFDTLEHGLEIIATIMQKLPEMTPNFSINQSPLMQFVEMIMANKDSQSTSPIGSIEDTPLRDDDGRFTHGENDEG